jgi:pseudoazurin
MKTAVAVAALLGVFAMAGGAMAADHQIQMLNKGEKGAMVFQPDFVKAEVGDTITFVPTDKGHDAESIKGMLPRGRRAVQGQDERADHREAGKGRCVRRQVHPHYGMGMVALVVVGKPVNLEEAKAAKHAGKAKKAFEALLAEVPAGN